MAAGVGAGIMPGMGTASQVSGSLLAVELGRENARPDPQFPEWKSALIAVGVFALLSVAAGVASVGFLEADACTHYIYARFALDEPHYLTNVWGRPFCTG